MNILITSAGRRVKVIQYFKEEFNNIEGKVIAADCDPLAPALYYAHDHVIIPRITETNYINSLIKICKEKNINAIVSLIDPELEILAQNETKFKENNIILVLSPKEIINIFFNKLKTHHYLTKQGIPSVPTYDNFNEVINLLKKKHLTFPLVVKPALGSASQGIHIVTNKDELKNIFETEDGLIIQPFYKDKEFGIDVYVDLKTGNIVDLFIKEKVIMRSGETDKSVSVHNDSIKNLIIDLISKTNFRGPIDIDCFKYMGKYYVSEVNPRFGGGYPHAHEMGCKFPSYIINNISEKANREFTGYKYKSGYAMMKYDDVLLMKNTK